MQPLSIQGEIFNDLRRNVDAALQMLVRRMLTTGIDQGTVTAKIGVELSDMGDMGDGKMEYMPKISFNVSMAMSQKEGIKGAVPMGLFLKSGQDGTMMIGDNQISMDEMIGGEV